MNARKRMVMLPFLLSVLMLFLLTACQGKQAASASTPTVAAAGPASGAGYSDVTAAELQEMLKDKDFTFVNVHIPFEGNIAGTDLSIPYDQIADNLDRLPANKEAKIVLYCRSGRMSTIAAEKLASLGYTNLFNLEGGMAAWEQAGNPIEK